MVDDSSTIRRIIEKELVGAGYEVLTAINGIEAISMLAWMDEKPDLITLDIDMPRMNGFEVCAKLNEDYRKQHNTVGTYKPIPIIFVSANDSLENRRRGFQLEILDFISKPFPQGALAKIVHDILNPNQQYSGQQVLVVDDSSPIRRIRNEDEITSPFMHPIFRPSLIDMKIEKSSHRPAMLWFSALQINQIRPKYGRLNREVISSSFLITKILQRLGVEVVKAKNGLEALQIIENGNNRFDLIVTDYMMPEMRGDELCRLARQNNKLQQVPIIIISAFDNQDLILAFFKAGATDYLAKPFIEEELLARLQSHLQARVYSRKLEKLNQKLTYLAERDGLTNLYNRRFFQETLHKEFTRAKQFQQDLCCILLDLDFFKKVNDQCGHAFGDLVLIEFSALLQIKVADLGIAARYGGEEFIILLPGKDREQTLKVAENIRQSAEGHTYSDGKQQRTVTASIGVSSIITNQAASPDQLVTMADEALYQAKDTGRNQVCVFSS